MKHDDRHERIAQELAALAQRGRLSPQRVVIWARKHRASALHGCFQWDDTRAAQQYRLWQARELIVSVEVVYEDGRQRQVYVSPITTRRGGQGYHRLVDVLSDNALRDGFLSQALYELERTCEKYADLHELAGVRAEVRLVRVGGRKAS
jgi:hypothetical protein